MIPLRSSNMMLINDLRGDGTRSGKIRSLEENHMQHWDSSQDPANITHLPKPLTTLIPVRSQFFLLYKEHYFFSRALLSEVRAESLFGPRPGTTVGEGSYNILIRLIHNREQLTMCKYHYHVTGETPFC